MSYRTIRSKIQNPQSLSRRLKSDQRKGMRVVFTNGCFDILHPGHVSYLESAKKKGDLLVVALDTDAAVRKLKGRTRPINSLSSRMHVIAALESVDYVTWFQKGDPRTIIKQLKPDVLVKGGDWPVSQILGSKEVLGWGGKVFSLTYKKGKSTTSLINTIRKL